MEKALSFVERLFDLTPEQQLFFVAVLALSLTGFALFVVLAVLKKVGPQ
jgi:hypothetical protein